MKDGACKKDGSQFWANVVITAMRDPAGEIIGFSKITRDLTERRRQEQLIHRSEERFRLLVDRVKDYAIFMLTPEGRVASWNEGAKRIKGYDANEIIGEHISRFYEAEAGRETLAGSRARGRTHDRQLRGRRLAGSQGWHAVLGERRHHGAARRCRKARTVLRRSRAI